MRAKILNVTTPLEVLDDREMFRRPATFRVSTHILEPAARLPPACNRRSDALLPGFLPRFFDRFQDHRRIVARDDRSLQDQALNAVCIYGGEQKPGACARMGTPEYRVLDPASMKLAIHMISKFNMTKRSTVGGCKSMSGKVNQKNPVVRPEGIDLA